MTLDAFYRAMAPMLEGTASPQVVIDTLGPTPSGAENLGFYSTLVERNHFKILFELFPILRALLLREHPGSWPKIVRQYRATHPATHWDPNRFAEHFSEHLRAMRERGALDHPIYEELADLVYLRQRVYSGHDLGPDAYDGRVVVRQYSHPTSDYYFALHEDPSAPLPQARPQVVFVYRHAQDHALHHFLPTAAGLAALARRQGITDLPPMFAALGEAQLEDADRALVEHGVFTPRAD
ncbi:MAG: hypothetical protein ACE37F_27385 [Nannocystaceae bacterium]|nr:putative DNA-binding domain-containing protein [bacterium]